MCAVLQNKRGRWFRAPYGIYGIEKSGNCLQAESKQASEWRFILNLLDVRLCETLSASDHVHITLIVQVSYHMHMRIFGCLENEEKGKRRKTRKIQFYGSLILLL